MGCRANRHIVLVFVSCLLAGFVLTASAQMATGPIEPGAGGWRTWVLASGKELRLAPPPDAQATATELQELCTLAAQRDAAALERIRYWDFWSPAHRSDVEAGWEIGRRVAVVFIERAKHDGAE
jgi:hypothetical protein